MSIVYNFKVSMTIKYSIDGGGVLKYEIVNRCQPCIVSMKCSFDESEVLKKI